MTYKFIIFPILTIFTIISLNIYYIPINSKNNNTVISYNNSNIRKLENKIHDNNIMLQWRKELAYQTKFLQLKNNIRENLFEGTVKYTNNLSPSENNTKTGFMTLKIFDRSDMLKLLFEYLSFKIKINENNTINNWIFIFKSRRQTLFNIKTNITNNFNNFQKDHIKNNVSFTFQNSSFSHFNSYINISYLSTIQRGKFFSRPYSQVYCYINYIVNFSIDKNAHSLKNEIKNITGYLYSRNCSEFTSMNFTLYKATLSKKSYLHVLLYSITSFLLGIFHIISTKLIFKKLDSSLVNTNAICLLTICQNILWNSYGCYCHFFLLLNYYNYRRYLGIVCLIDSLNFGFIEFPLLYYLFSKRYAHLITDVLVLRKTILQYCFAFYMVMLFTFIFVMKCYYSPPFILFTITITWIPQIIYNINYNNKVSFPLIYYIDIVLNRLFPSFYFNFFKDNFLGISINRNIVIICIIILVSSTLILYCQYIFGPKYFLPGLNELIPEFDMYKNEKELRKIVKDVDNLDCLICLAPIIIKNNEQQNINSYNINATNNNETENLVINVKGDFEKINNNNNCCNCEIFKIKLIGDESKFWNFHEYNKNIYNKKFMITPCNHVFHTQCLEEWFKMKKECPKCRTEIDDEI